MSKTKKSFISLLIAGVLTASMLPQMAFAVDSVTISTTDGLASTVGNTLRADVINTNGTATFQWYAGDIAIAGATLQEFSPTYEQLEKDVKCVVTDSTGESESNALSITSRFDSHKAEKWNDLSVVTLGTEPKGFGNSDWEFSMQNGAGETKKFSLLDVQNNKSSKYFVLANEYYVLRQNCTANANLINDSIYNPNIAGTVAYNVNLAHMNKGQSNNFPDAIIDAIDKNHVWITEQSFDGYIQAPYTFKAGVVTPAIWEIEEYIDRVKIDVRKTNQNSKAWLRTPYKQSYYQSIRADYLVNGNYTVPMVQKSAASGNYQFRIGGISIKDENGYTRPQFFLNENFFKRAKINLETAGAGIISEISKCSYNELINVYTDEEIETYLPLVEKTAVATITTTDAGAPAIGNTLKADAMNTSGTVAYQWYADGAVIPGASEQTFVPTYAQLGKKITCVLTDDSGTIGSNSVDLTSSFDKYKTKSYENMTAITIGDNDGTGDGSWEFNVGGKSFSLLDIQNNDKGAFFILANDLYGKQYCSDSKALWNPNAEGTLAQYMNYELLNTGGFAVALPESIINSIDKNHVWITEKGHKSDTTITEPYTFSAAVTAPALWEIEEYISKIKMEVRNESQIAAKDSIWFRTAYSDSYYHGLDGTSVPIVKHSSVSNQNYFKPIPLNITSSVAWIRPQFFLNKDFFKKVKIDLTTAGENVINTIKSMYTTRELLGIYSRSELLAAGFTLDFDVTVSWTDGVNELLALTGANKITANVNIKSNIDEAHPAVAIVALYDGDGRLIAADLKTITLNANTDNPVELNLSELSGITNSCSAKVMLWDGLDTLGTIAGEPFKFSTGVFASTASLSTATRSKVFF